MCNCGACLELLCYYQVFVHFPMGFPWNGLVCGVVGDILKQTKIFFLETSGLQGWIARQSLPNQACFGLEKCLNVDPFGI
jgi:hypothetical protein